MRIFIGMETSGALRRRFADQGHDVISCDILPAEDEAETGGHVIGDAFDTLEDLRLLGWWPDFAMFHITCTYLTNSAAWAFNDPDYSRYPGVGYHQRVKPGTLVGPARRAARQASMEEFRRVRRLPIRRKVVENPVGALSQIMKPTQIIQPYEFGDDASKATCLWIMDENGEAVSDMRLPIDPALRCPGRLVPFERAMRRPRKDGDPEFVERWSNQTDTGQNALSPDDDRWKDRSRTFPGIADAMAARWGREPVIAPIQYRTQGDLFDVASPSCC